MCSFIPIVYLWRPAGKPVLSPGDGDLFGVDVMTATESRFRLVAEQSCSIIDPWVLHARSVMVGKTTNQGLWREESARMGRRGGKACSGLDEPGSAVAGAL
jgi:hypothetical protein